MPRRDDEFDDDDRPRRRRPRDDEDDDRPSRARRPRLDDDERPRRRRFEDDDDRSPPRKKSSLPLILGIVGGILLLCCGGGGIGLYFLGDLFVGEVKDRTQSANNLAQIGVAFHNHQDAKGFLPNNSYAPDGKPLYPSGRNLRKITAWRAGNENAIPGEHSRRDNQHVHGGRGRRGR
jgi:hypothetical protein